MGQDGGGDITKQFQQDPLGAILNVATQLGSAGIVGYENGKFKKGVTTHAADETLGELTGRNMARDQAWKAQKRLDAEDAQREQDLKNQRERNRLSDVNASNSAQAIRSSGAAKAARNLSQMGSFSDEQDFLGL